MNKSKKNFIIFILILVIITILLPFVINFIFGIIVPILPGTMYVGTNESWVIFIGGFLGASFTLVGVYWQLEKTKEQQNKDLISNTYATYQLLKNEINNYIENFKSPFQVYEGIKFLKTKLKPQENITEKDEDFFMGAAKIGFQDLCYEFNFKKQDLNSYINLSKPTEKTILLELTNDLSKLIIEIKKNISDIVTSENKFLGCHLEGKLKETELKKMEDLKEKIISMENKFKKEYPLN